MAGLMPAKPDSPWTHGKGTSEGLGFLIASIFLQKIE